MKIKNLSPVDKMNVELFEGKISVITDVVCKFYGISRQQAFGKDKHEIYMKARRMIQYISREQCKACPFGIIGYLTGGFDHNSVRNNCNKMNAKLRDKTLLGRCMNPDVVNEYQRVHGYVVYELSKMESGDQKGVESVNIWLSEDVSNRLSAHCKSTGITKSMFVRTLVVDELNRLQNVTRLH